MKNWVILCDLLHKSILSSMVLLLPTAWLLDNLYTFVLILVDNLYTFTSQLTPLFGMWDEST